MRWRDRVLPGLIALGFIALAVLAFHFVFNAFFLSDDFAFLQAAKAGEWIWPSQLNGTFFRPLTLLSFRVTYALFGLNPRPYHLVNIGLHIVSALAIYGLARQLSGRTWPSAAAGAVFLVFAGHGEAVSWISGRADVLATTGVLVGLYAAARAMVQRDAALWWAASIAAFAGALLSKESAAIAPLLVLALVAVMPAEGTSQRSRAMLVAIVGGLTAAVLVARRLLLGVTFGGYGSFGASHLFDSPGAFVYRALLPGSPFPVLPHPAGTALTGFAVLCGAAIFLAISRRDRTPLFAAAAMVIALLPVLSLSISLMDIQSERLIYMPSAFGAMLIASTILGVAECAGARPVGYLLLAVFCAANLRFLRLTNTRFAAAGGLAQRVVAGLGEQIGRAPAGAQTFILNLPDTHYGIYVFRNGLSESVSLFHPELFGGGDRFVLAVAREITLSPTQGAVVTRTGPASFHSELVGPLAAVPVSGTFTNIRNASAHAYDVSFHGVDRALVLYVADGRVESAGVVSGTPVPFGVIDVPAAAAECAGDDLRLAGWVLFSGPQPHVSISADARGAAGDALLGGRRDDIQAVFPGFRDALHAGWEFHLKCAALAPGSTTTIRVVASDANGSTALGDRAIHRPAGGAQ